MATARRLLKCSGMWISQAMELGGARHHLDDVMQPDTAGCDFVLELVILWFSSFKSLGSIRTGREPLSFEGRDHCDSRARKEPADTDVAPDILEPPSDFGIHYGAPVGYSFGWWARLSTLVASLDFKQSWVFSSALSGTGSAEIASELLSQISCGHGSPFVKGWAFDYGTGPQAILRGLPSVDHLGCSLLDLWPSGFVDRFHQQCHNLDAAIRYCKLRAAQLKHHVFCNKCQAVHSFHLGDAHVAGPPCIDFSSMGLKAGFSGRTLLAFVTWILLILRDQP